MSAAHDYLSANREYFDKQALTIDDRPNAQEQPRRIGNAIRRKYGSLFDEETTTLMDFACGTGPISRYLCPYVKSVVGVDISQDMVDHYNLLVENQGIPYEEMKAVRAELERNDTVLEGRKFDIIVVRGL